jgi:hypothetical protein
MKTQTTAADRFLTAVSTAWDSLAPWTDTARLGLSETDEAALAALCDETGEDYDAAEAAVLAAVRAKAAR